jgi:exodeoxyribonuclease V alpha subunit
MDTLRGVVERITFHNEETGYTVAKLTPEATARTLFGAAREVTIVGAMLGLNVGECVELTGRWTVHSDYGRQFQVETFRPVLPATIAGLEKYLGSGLIKGVGPVTAHRIVKQFGLDALTIIEEQPERLIEAPGVGPKRVEMIRKAWVEQRVIKEVMLFLQSHGVSTSLAAKIYKTYGDDAIHIVRSDPYRLARDIFGVGFLTADKIARSLGMPEDAPERVAAGVAYALNQASEEGHVFLPTSELVKLTAELLNAPPSLIGLGLARLWNEGQVKVAPGAGGEAIEPQTAFVAEPRLVAEQGQLYAVHTVEEAQRLLAEENAVSQAPPRGGGGRVKGRGRGRELNSSRKASSVRGTPRASRSGATSPSSSTASARSRRLCQSFSSISRPSGRNHTTSRRPAASGAPVRKRLRRKTGCARRKATALRTKSRKRRARSSRSQAYQVVGLSWQ